MWTYVGEMEKETLACVDKIMIASLAESALRKNVPPDVQACKWELNNLTGIVILGQMAARLYVNLKTKTLLWKCYCWDRETTEDSIQSWLRLRSLGDFRFREKQWKLPQTRLWMPVGKLVFVVKSLSVAVSSSDIIDVRRFNIGKWCWCGGCWCDGSGRSGCWWLWFSAAWVSQ